MWGFPTPRRPWAICAGRRRRRSVPGPARCRPRRPATSVSARCHHRRYNGSEDCLNLNVQVPDGAGSSRLPVMVEIHGGGFLLPVGPASDAHLVSAGHVVHVAMNYRLGTLGFMANRALGPHSGDYGLQDQQASLRWVRQNIAAFGGDPNDVTILGQSAGGASVCANVASPTAKGLFERGIPEGGF
jgi:para-nitrobenzyl esterase